MLKIGLITDKNHEKIAKDLVKWAKLKLPKVKLSVVNKKANANSILDNCDHAVNLLNTKKLDRLVCIDEWGIAAFMYLAKFPHLVVAEINDEHSAYMTTLHNNSNVISLGSKITTVDQMKNIIIYFVNSTYEGARHKVRIDMMEKLVEGCGC
ncbi:MAG: RpiB/LacA/LacB family sugar-phosphate isomerase [Mycoplasma sp.]